MFSRGREETSMNKRYWEDLGTGLNWKLLSSNDIHAVSPSRYAHTIRLSDCRSLPRTRWQFSIPLRFLSPITSTTLWLPDPSPHWSSLTIPLFTAHLRLCWRSDTCALSICALSVLFTLVHFSTLAHFLHVSILWKFRSPHDIKNRNICVLTRNRRKIAFTQRFKVRMMTF